MENDRGNRDESEASIDEILNQIGFGRVHLWILLTCGFYSMGTTTESMGIAIIGPLLTCDFKVNETEHSMLNGAVFLGMVVSSFFWSFFCDIYGRRKILLFSVYTSTPISLISMLMPEYYSFLLLRVVVGAFIAGPSFVCMTYLSEFCMQRHIAVMGDLLAIFNGFGSLYFIGLASFVTHWNLEDLIIGSFTLHNWRVLGFLYTIPSICGMLLLIKLPETPKFLILKYKTNECQAVLEWLCKSNTGKSLDNVTTHNVKANTPSLILLRERMMAVKMWMGLRKLFTWHYMKRLLPVCILQFFIFLIANGMGLWFTDFRNRAHAHCRNLLDICCASHLPLDSCYEHGLTFTDSLLMAAVFILVCIALAVSLHFTSRRIAFSMSLCIAAVCGYVLPFVHHDKATVLTIILFLTINAAITNLLRSAVVEFMPTVMRAKAGAFCFLCGRMGVVLGTSILGILLKNYCVESFLILASFSLIAGILAASGLIFP